MTIITIAGFKANLNEFTSVVSSKEIHGSWGEILWAGAKYTGLQSLVLCALLGAAGPLKTKGDIKKFSILGFLMNGIMITASCCMLLAWLPLIKDETLPILTIIQSLDNKLLLVCYSVTLLAAFITTGVSCVFGAVARYEGGISFINDFTKKRSFISFVVIFVSLLLSLLGLDTLVIKGYGLAGIISIFILVIPTIIVGSIKNRRMEKSNN